MLGTDLGIAGTSLVSSGGVASLPYDDLTTGLLALFSVGRRLLTSYGSGDPLIRVYNGTSEADIGSSGNRLDEAAVATHCGANPGRAELVYDQSGNANNASDPQNNANRIWDGSAIHTSGGRPSLRSIDGVAGSIHEFGQGGSLVTAAAGFTVSALIANDTFTRTVAAFGDNAGQFLRLHRTSTTYIVGDGVNSITLNSGTPTAMQHVIWTCAAGGTIGNCKVYRDGVELAVSASSGPGTAVAIANTSARWGSNANTLSGTWAFYKSQFAVWSRVLTADEIAAVHADAATEFGL